MSAGVGTREAAGRLASSAATVGRIAAVVLNYRTPEASGRAVQSLLTSTRPLDVVILVDNHPLSDAPPIPVASAVRYVATDRNLGFSGGMNVGIRLALAEGADAVLLVNSDAVVAPEAVAALESCLTRVPDAGIAGPVLRGRATPGVVTSRGLSYDRRSGRMRDRVLERRAPVGLRWQVVDALSGCVMLIRRRVFEVIGLLDEAYFFSFEDLDFCLAAGQAGFTSLIVEAATAWHDGSYTIGAESPRRLYFAARNHLRLAARVTPRSGRAAAMARAAAIIGFNAAHAVRSQGGSVFERLGAVAAGTRDHLAGRYGDPEGSGHES